MISFCKVTKLFMYIVLLSDDKVYKLDIEIPLLCASSIPAMNVDQSQIIKTYLPSKRTPTISF